MIKDIEGLLNKITSEIKERTDVAIIGLSGGADSTLVACLCKLALGEENVVGVHMPYGSEDFDYFNARSIKLSEKLNIKSFTTPIAPIVNELDKVVLSTDPSPYFVLNKLNLGNSRSRIRMCILYSLAHETGFIRKKRARVVGTGNLSEDWIGYDTKGGDALSDFFPIGDLFKSEVYQLLDYFRDNGTITEELIDRTPSAGLWSGQTDEQEIGYSYNEMEPAIKFLIDPNAEPIDVEEGSRFDQILSFVATRHAANKHKHEAPPVISLRHLCD